MIRMIQSNSASQAKAYFSEALAQADYYINHQELQGKFEGKLAVRLSIIGTATKEIFFALAENINPQTGMPLTPRTKEDRTVGYDINFHCPKSVSIVHALSKDNHILKAFEETVSDTMQDIEADCQTRIRKGGQYDDRNTGELIWAEFTHLTARPVKNHTPDPHLHSHCFVFNATWDKEENQYKAAKFRGIKRDMPYYQARFQKRLSDKLVTLGYQVRLTDKSFEIDGVPENVIDLFSKRTDEIGRVAKEKGITDAKRLDELGVRTRSKKQKRLTMAQLQSSWRTQIHNLGIEGNKESENKTIRFAPKKGNARNSARECMDYAINHSFERVSVMHDRRLLTNAYRHSLGQDNISLENITDHFKFDNRLIFVKEKSRLMCTTRDVLREEKKMVDLAKKGIGILTPLYQQAPSTKLKDGQANAVEHILTTPNRVAIIRGAAGTGKTTLMREAINHIQQAGKTVTVVAPTAEASRGVLKEEGFAGAETVARLLIDQELKDSIENQVLWVDEAGLLGTQDMTALLTLVEKKNARLILGGDTRQHASVVRGDALRILNTAGGIPAAEVNKIYRQKNVHYRMAVEDLSKGNVKEGFDKLDQLGAIKSVDPLKPNETLVDDYLIALKRGKSVLVISPTHKQGNAVTEDIRVRLRQIGKIGKKEIAANRLVNRNLTAAQKSDQRNYKAGQVVQFNQNLPGIRRGSTWLVKTMNEEHVMISDEMGNSQALPIAKSDHFDVYDKSTINLSKGDKIRIAKNGFDTKDRRLNNGQTLEVSSVNKSGKIIVKNTASKATYVLDDRFGHIAHAYCITSQASQGKTVDEIFIAQPSATFSATDAKQFYVSVSRAREQVHIYTDDKTALLEQASELGERQSALELISSKRKHQNYVHDQHRNSAPSLTQNVERRKIENMKENKIAVNYEPAF